ncbi:DUF5615 family PIN-like protein [Allomesorhizobium alhagi]|uniref:VapC45 PIN like domain-containing protein n=1 Tax=Mesorhizobium alhagi CCNWXJ12-2 TaxID=1107882 RepID=H0HZZ8_9HYPH|nr:DUF5615 family PIN-like protein [Mesorhizobium alhagi]EHK53685.1 hypothetical protein MAXJ12_28923 [Mesorhizobium alhagi CCNWXJ12-2]
MKVLIDENLPPALAKALHALFNGDHEVVHLRARFGPGVSDREWIEELSAEGLWIVISGDRRITRNRVEYAAFRKSRLVGFFLSKGLYKAPLIKQMERILALWGAIEAQSGLVAGGAMFLLPMKSTKLEQLK